MSTASPCLQNEVTLLNTLLHVVAVWLFHFQEIENTELPISLQILLKYDCIQQYLNTIATIHYTSWGAESLQLSHLSGMSLDTKLCLHHAHALLQGCVIHEVSWSPLAQFRQIPRAVAKPFTDSVSNS